MRRMLDPKEAGGGGSLTNKLFQHSLKIKSGSNRKYWVEFTLLTATPDKFTTIKAIHDYMIEAYGERFHITGFVWDSNEGTNGVHISPYEASANTLSITMLYQKTENDRIGESIINIDDSNATITDKVFKLI